MDGGPAEAHRLNLRDSRHDAIVLAVKPLALGIARRRRDHALQADLGGIAARGFGVPTNRGERRSRTGRVRNATRGPPGAPTDDAARRRARTSGGPDRYAAGTRQR